MPDQPPNASARISVEAAAALLDSEIALVRELIAHGVLSASGEELNRGEVLAYRARRAERLTAVDEISDIVGRFPGGWTS